MLPITTNAKGSNQPQEDPPVQTAFSFVVKLVPMLVIVETVGINMWESGGKFRRPGSSVGSATDLLRP